MIYLNKNMKNRFGKSENNLFTEKEMKKKSCSQIAVLTSAEESIKVGGLNGVWKREINI